MTPTNQVGEPAEKPVPLSQLSAHSSTALHTKDVVDLGQSRNRRRFNIGFGVAFALLLAGSPWWWPASVRRQAISWHGARRTSAQPGRRR